MIKAIVYKSNTGFSEKYASELSKITGLPYGTLEEIDALPNIDYDDEMAFVGWMRTGTVQGYQQCWKKYETPVLCTVGLYHKSQKLYDYIKRNNIVVDTKIFMLPGGLKPEKLGFFDRMVMKKLVRDAEKKKLKGREQTIDDLALIEADQNGMDRTDLSLLSEIADYIKNYNEGNLENEE